MCIRDRPDVAASSGGHRRAAVLGSPISHSLSPTLHRAAYASLGLDWTYDAFDAVSYTHLRAHETVLDLVCRLLLEKKKKKRKKGYRVKNGHRIIEVYHHTK